MLVWQQDKDVNRTRFSNEVETRAAFQRVLLGLSTSFVPQCKTPILADTGLVPRGVPGDI